MNPTARPPAARRRSAKGAAPPPRLASGDQSRTAILDTAEALVKDRGYTGFSYRDVAAALSVTTTAVHYHFPAKEDLGAALVSRYRAGLREELEAFDARHADPSERLRAFAAMFRGGPGRREVAFCLCGMLAAERGALPPALMPEVEGFFADARAWLGRALDEGRRAGRLRFEGTGDERSAVLMAAVEGALLLARASGQGRRYDEILSRVLADLEGGQGHATEWR